ncbi:MAG: Cna B-type domain-containing protein [Bifidobacteriaceae bacterium]|nr:Cna B-type domain-containing protein [Bifidobacteriaceae bacterium]
MMRHRLATRLAPALLCVASMLAAFGLGAAPAMATDDVPTAGGNGTITATFHYKGQPVADSHFLLYKIADWDEKNQDAKLSESITDEFKTNAYKDVKWEQLDAMSGIDRDGSARSASEWKNLAGQLYGYLKLNGFATKTVADGNTNAEGVVSFTGLSDGVYFLVSPLSSAPKAVSSAQLISIPQGTAAQYADRQVSVNVKGEAANGNDPIKVTKIWDDGNAADRPTSVTMTLYYKYDEEGGYEKYQTVELNASNNWTYQWDRLPETLDYEVIEVDVPDGYTVSREVDHVDKDHSDWTFTNHKTHSDQPPTVTTVSVPPVASNDTPAHTGAEIAAVLAIGVASLILGVLLVIKARRAEV